MEYGETERKDFLVELYRQTEGDVDRQVGMRDVGAAIGMEKSAASSIAEDMIMDGLVELKTLSGAIGITNKGLDHLQNQGLVVSGAPAAGYSLSGNAVLTAEDLDTVAEMLGDIRLALDGVRKGYEECEEAVVDIKTIEVQMLSGRPKTAIILAVFSSLRDVLKKLNLEDTAGIISDILSHH